jgi:hypothetical protein
VFEEKSFEELLNSTHLGVIRNKFTESWHELISDTPKELESVKNIPLTGTGSELNG